MTPTGERARVGGIRLWDTQQKLFLEEDFRLFWSGGVDWRAGLGGALVGVFLGRMARWRALGSALLWLILPLLSLWPDYPFWQQAAQRLYLSHPGPAELRLGFFVISFVPFLLAVVAASGILLEGERKEGRFWWGWLGGVALLGARDAPLWALPAMVWLLLPLLLRKIGRAHV